MVLNQDSTLDRVALNHEATSFLVDSNHVATSVFVPENQFDVSFFALSNHAAHADFVSPNHAAQLALRNDVVIACEVLSVDRDCSPEITAMIGASAAVSIPYRITQLTSITDEMVMDYPGIEVILPQFLEFVGDAPLVAHNAGFDVGFIEQNCRYQDIEPHFVSVDTVALARVLLPSLSKYKLDVVAKALDISLENHHRAVDDAGATAEIFVKFIEMLKERDITTLKGVNRFGNLNPDAIRKLPTYHVIILAKNDLGRVNLYTLVSLSHLTYYGRRPRIPKSVLNQYREGLIVGSACEAGECMRHI